MSARPARHCTAQVVRVCRVLITPQVQDTRPAGLRENYTDISAVQKYEMPAEEYENRTDSVLAWKKAQKLGRFDPSAPSIEEQKIHAVQREIDERGKHGACQS